MRLLIDNENKNYHGIEEEELNEKLIWIIIKSYY